MTAGQIVFSNDKIDIIEYTSGGTAVFYRGLGGYSLAHDQRFQRMTDLTPYLDWMVIDPNDEDRTYSIAQLLRGEADKPTPPREVPMSDPESKGSKVLRSLTPEQFEVVSRYLFDRLWTVMKHDEKVRALLTQPNYFQPWGHSWYPVVVSGFGACQAWERVHMQDPVIQVGENEFRVYSKDGVFLAFDSLDKAKNHVDLEILKKDPTAVLDGGVHPLPEEKTDV